MDFRDLNRATPKDEYPMPVAETLINAAAGHKMLSFMDGNAGYNQIFMAPEDIHKTAFRVPGAVGPPTIDCRSSSSRAHCSFSRSLELSLSSSYTVVT
jgi:hypothetical protein